MPPATAHDSGTATGWVRHCTALAIMVVATAVALGAFSRDLPASARMVAITAIVTALAPLAWPGRGADAAATAVRVLAWSVVATALAGLVLLVAGGMGLSISRSVPAAVMLLLILLATHACAAILEGLARRRSRTAEGAREVAAWVATTALVVVGAAPLWLAPVAELSSQTRVTNAIVALSPLTHLAVASGNDLLRNQWFYQHSNLAALPLSYPRLEALFVCYLAAILALMLIPVALGSMRIGRARR